MNTDRVLWFQNQGLTMSSYIVVFSGTHSDTPHKYAISLLEISDEQYMGRYQKHLKMIFAQKSNTRTIHKITVVRCGLKSSLYPDVSHLSNPYTTFTIFRELKNRFLRVLDLDYLESLD